MPPCGPGVPPAKSEVPGGPRVPIKAVYRGISHFKCTARPAPARAQSAEYVSRFRVLHYFQCGIASD
ncbi:hypothetical protein EVAR_66429_1 [Eumeta japonica]|uniref:Uncharacterized protein n=1 Tax=Eumeta variegata TaxID=151549 RepID=A0A4C1ZKN6_EUMVA|nr:hypothetical protein EVAR_66429_1 [Eumeta japonica]